MFTGGFPGPPKSWDYVRFPAIREDGRSMRGECFFFFLISDFKAIMIVNSRLLQRVHQVCKFLCYVSL